MTANDNEPKEPPDQNRRGSIAALVAVVLLGLVLFGAMSAIRKHDAVQNCIDSGRHDCVDLGDAAH